MESLDKFFNLKVENTALSEYDKNYFLELNKIYYQSLEDYCLWYEIYHNRMVVLDDEMNNKGKKIYGQDDIVIKDLDICNNILRLHSNFIDCIYNYLLKEYHIEFKRNDMLNLKEYFNYDYVNKTIDIRPLDYNVFLKDIYFQLNGMSFEEFRKSQIKADLIKIVYADMNPCFEVKNNNVILNNVIHWDYDNQADPYDFEKIIKALGWFESDKEVSFFQLTKFKSHCINWEDMNQDINIEAKKLKSVKLYKNGRVDIKFQQASQARQFVSEWFGYMFNGRNE